MKLYKLFIFPFLFILILFSVSCNPDNINNIEYLLHKAITVTVFWIDEESTVENGYISNQPSAWDEKWVEHFYFALPYNDFYENGKKMSQCVKIDGKK